MELFFVIILIAIFIGAMVANSKSRSAGEDIPETKPRSVPLYSSAASPAAAAAEPQKNGNSVSADQLYADRNNMWVCQFCETLNVYPEGMTKPRKIVSPVPEKDNSEEPRSLLRGDLASKAKGSPTAAPTNSEEICLTCIACQREQ